MRLGAKVGLLLVSIPFVATATVLGCGSDEENGSPPTDDAGDAGSDAVIGDATTDNNWEYKTYECPAPTGSFPPGQDKWSPLVELRQKNQGLWIPPIHIMLQANGRVLMPGANMRATRDAGVIQATSNFILTPDDPTADMVLELQEIGSPHHEPASENLFCTGHAPMADGRYLMAGGNKEGQYCDDAGACVEALRGLDYGLTYDQATESFTIIDQKMTGGRRWYPTVTRLADGRMMVTAGDAVAELVKNHSVEVFDPLKNEWRMLSDEANTPKEVEITANYVHTFLLPKPVVAEGQPRDTVVMGEGGHMFLFSAKEPFEGAQAQRWAKRAQRPGPGFSNIIPAHGASSIPVPFIPRNEGRFNQGSILVVGGSEDETIEETAEVYDPYQDKWCPASAKLGIKRFEPSTTLLPDGNVLIVGGGPFPTVYGENQPQRTPQILDPRTGAVYNGTPWPDPFTRGYHTTLLLLPDGRVIVAGGRTFAGGNPDVTTFWDERTDMRYYYPPYFGPILAGKARPAITGAPDVVPYQAPIDVSYGDGPIDMVAIVGLGAQTHCVDMNARHIQLDFEGGTAPGGTIKIHGPLDASTAPAGPYMLFLMHKVDGWMVPSVAKMVFVR